jgi:hypothetical protein
MAVTTDSGLIIPELTTTSSVRRFASTMGERGMREAVALETCAAYCAREWDALPGVNTPQFGRNGGTRTARHLRYMAKLDRQMAKAADQLWADYNALVYGPWRRATGATSKFNPGR